MRPVAILALLLCLAHMATTAVFGPDARGSLASNLLQALLAATACAASAGAARRSSGLSRRFWALVALAFAIWCLGQLTYAYHENWVGERVPQPSWTHFLFRLYGAPLIMALLIGQERERRSGHDHDWLRTLDAAQVGILFLLFYFDLYFVPGGQFQGLTLLYLWGFFDLSDLENWGLFTAFLIRSRLSSRADERAVSGRLLPYLLAYAASSSFANYTYLLRAPRSGDWTDLGFSLSLTLGALLAATWSERGTVEPSESTGGAVTWAPALLPVITIGLALPMARSEPGVAFIAVAGSVACFGARLILTLYRRRRLTHELQASEARYARLLRLAPDAIFVHTGGVITFANPATARLLGFTNPEAVVGRHVLDFAPPHLRAQFAPRVAGNDEGATPLTVVRGDGALISLEAVGMNLGSPKDPTTPLSRLVIARDVTERTRAEAERESLVQALEAKNAELERFTYSASHDLRSPLVTIGSYLSHVEEAAARGDIEALRQDIERIRRAARRMDRLLKDLLEFSRVGHGMGTPETFPLAPLVRDAAAMARGALEGRGVEVVVAVDLPEVRGDRVRLLQVIQNLLDNAARFMGDQKVPRVDVGSRRDGDEAVFFVRDNGIGIERQHQQRIFGLFDKLDPKGPGTGVGLALVKRIIEQHGGRIWVESEGALKGSTFCFTLNVSDVPEVVGS